MIDIEQLFQSTYRQLRQTNRRFCLVAAFREALQLLFVLLLLLLAIGLLDMLFDLKPLARVTAAAVLGVIVLTFTLRRIFPQVRAAFFPGEKDIQQISRRIGDQDSGIQDSLINFLQIYNAQGITSHDHFRSLGLRQLHERFHHSEFSRIVSLQSLNLPGIRTLAAVGGMLLLFLMFPGAMSQAMLKMMHPLRQFEAALPVALSNASGDLQVLKNDPVKLAGSYSGITPHRLRLVVRNEEGPADSAAVERIEIPVGPGKQFSYTFNHVKSGFSYWFEAQVEASSFRNRIARSEQGRVVVQERPFVRNLQVKLEYPRYTRLPSNLMAPNKGEVTALPGTRIHVDIEANKKLQRALLLFQDSSMVTLQVVENRASGVFTLKGDSHYQVIIEDDAGIANYRPVIYALFTLRDERPFVEITAPGKDLDLGSELSLGVQMNLRDDFGFRSLAIKGRHIRNGAGGDTVLFDVPVPFDRLDQNRASAAFTWDLSPFFLIPDDYIEYFAEVYDNDTVSGPKSSRSKTYVLRLPSVIDILERGDETLSKQIDETEDLQKETEALREKLEEINRELKREQELTWERKKEIQDQLHEQKETMEKLEEIQQEVEQMVNELDKQDLLSAETLDKYFELQKMFQELATPELMKAMEKLQKALEESDMENIQQAMEDFKLSMEEFQQRIERTHELFKRIEMEQKMEELVQLAEQMAEEQQEINEQLAQEDLSQEQQEQLAEQEKSLEKTADFFEERLKETQEKMQERMAETAEDLQKAQEFLEEQQLGEQMSQMQQQMQQGQQQQSQQSGEQLERQLEQLQSMMQQARQDMQRAQKQEVMAEMHKIQQDLLRASFQQEQLMERSNHADVASSQLNQIARQQSQLRENTANVVKEMIELSKKTFFVSPQLSTVMSAMMGNMGESLEGLSNRNPRQAGRSQQKAMASFNQAIMMMQNSMNQLSQSNSASGMEQFMQQMQQMAGQQGQLNQQSMGLFQQQGQGRKPSPQQMAQMAAQQAMIQKSMEQLMEQTGERGDVMGRLGDLGEEMEAVVEALKRQQIDRKVINRQQQILSRMLDAQKSVREKEHSKKRQAEREDAVVAKSPAALRQEQLNQENALRKEMLDALKEGYSSEYKDFIKTYYELLSRQPGNNR